MANNTDVNIDQESRQKHFYYNKCPVCGKSDCEQYRRHLLELSKTVRWK